MYACIEYLQAIFMRHVLRVTRQEAVLVEALLFKVLLCATHRGVDVPALDRKKAYDFNPAKVKVGAPSLII